MTPIILRPEGPFDFISKWKEPAWKAQGVYLWTIPFRGAYLASYAGQTCGKSTNFDTRIWREYDKHWRGGDDRPVDIEAYKLGKRNELESRPEGHLLRELEQLTPLIRLWLMPLTGEAECDQAERWLVAQFCKHGMTRQFLANCNPDRYRPDTSWAVSFDAPETCKVFGLNWPCEEVMP